MIYRQRSLQGPEQMPHQLLPQPLVGPWAPANGGPSSRADRPGESQAGLSLSLSLPLRAIPDQPFSSCCSLWLWLHSSSAGSTWLRTTSWTLTCDHSAPLWQNYTGLFCSNRVCQGTGLIPASVTISCSFNTIFTLLSFLRRMFFVSYLATADIFIPSVVCLRPFLHYLIKTVM